MPITAVFATLIHPAMDQLRHSKAVPIDAWGFYPWRQVFYSLFPAVQAKDMVFHITRSFDQVFCDKYVSFQLRFGVTWLQSNSVFVGHLPTTLTV